MQASDHSLAQLKLLSTTGRRLRAEQGMIDLQVAVAGTAASMAKDGSRLVKRVQKMLEHELNGK